MHNNLCFCSNLISKDLADEYLELTSYSSTPVVAFDDTGNDVTDALINEFDALYETVTSSVVTY